jgi:hypothetical protein
VTLPLDPCSIATYGVIAMSLRRDVLPLVLGAAVMAAAPAAASDPAATASGPAGTNDPAATSDPAVLLAGVASAPQAVGDVVPDVETLSDVDGPYAARQRGPDGRWASPQGDAVLIDEAWWTPLRPLLAVPAPDPIADPSILARIRAEVAPAATRRPPDRLTDAALGDVTLDGTPDLVVSFRRPFQRNLINMTRPRRAWADEQGLSAHIGLYRPGDLSTIWIAGTLVRPVVELAACDGALAVAYGTLDEPGTVATDAWRWAVFGFLPVEPLPGPGTPICVDIDGDGRTEPAITGRSAP